MKNATLLCCLLFLSSCLNQQEDWTFQSLTQQQPKVVGISPDDTLIESSLPSWSVEFSEKIDPDSFDETNLFLVPGAYNTDQNILDLKEKLAETAHPLTFSWSDDFTSLNIEVITPLTRNQYSLIVCGPFQSQNKIPFNQDPGSAQHIFIKIFQNEILGNEEPTNNLDIPLKINRPDFFIINEVLYDALGSDSNGNLFIELYGSPNTEISNYRILFLNGEDSSVSKELSFPNETFIPDDGLFVLAPPKSTIAKDIIDWSIQFDPQNGPDAIVIVSPDGEILDSLSYGTGPLPLVWQDLPINEGQSAKDVEAGQSLSRENGIDTNQNSEDFIILDEPSPGIL